MLEYQKSSAALGLATQLIVGRKFLNPILSQRAQPNQQAQQQKAYTSQNTRDLVSLTSHLTIHDGDTYDEYAQLTHFFAPSQRTVR